MTHFYCLNTAWHAQSVQKQKRIREILDGSSLPAYMIHIQDNRDLSNQVADQFEIKHESPQFFYVKDGAVNYHNSSLAHKYDTLKRL